MPPLHRFFAALSLITLILTAHPALSAGLADHNANQDEITEALRQRLQPEHIAGKIVQHLQAKDYEQAEAILAELLTTKPIDVDGYRLLEKVYLLLSYTKQTRILDDWSKSRPSSHFPLTVRGLHYFEKARILDGANQTLLLNERQRRDFDVFLRRARADLEKAYALDPAAPGPSAALAALTIQLKQPRSVMEEWFARSVKADPAWLGGYQAKLMYLAPWRNGSDQMMRQFAVQCFTTDAEEANTFIVTLDWIKLKSDRIGSSLDVIRFLTEPTVYSMLSEGLDRYIESYPLSYRIEAYRKMNETIRSQPYISIAAFSDLIVQNPEDPVFLRGRISAYLANKQFEEAAADLQSLEALEGTTPFSLAGNAAVLYRSHRDLESGNRLYDRAISSATSSYRRKYYLLDQAEINRSYGNCIPAIDDFSAAIEEDILFEKAYLGRAKCQYALGNLDAALADLIILKSSIRGTLANHARSLINTYMKAARDKLTSRDFSSDNPLLRPTRPLQPAESTASKTKPEDKSYREHLIKGLHRFYQNDYETARRDFYRVIAAEPAEAKAYYMLGLIAEQVDFDFVKAGVFYEHAFRLAPESADYLLGVSRTRYRNRDFTEAMRSLTDFMAQADQMEISSQTGAQIHFMRGLCLEELGLIPEALIDMGEALRLDPQLTAAAIFIKDHAPESAASEAGALTRYKKQITSPQTDVNIDQLLENGRNLMMEGNLEQARISFLKVIRLNPDIAEAYYQLGRISFEKDHDYPKARLYYTQAIERNPEDPRYYFDRAAIHYYFRQYEMAIDDFSMVLDLQPNNEQGIYYRGVCNHMLGNVEEARRDFNTLRLADNRWDIEIDRFRNAWNTEIDQFLNAAGQ